MMRALLPNLITLCNLFCGAIAVVFALQGDLHYAALFVFLGIFFDFFDGLAARALNASSAIGLQLDSLADVVTSGLAPALVMVQLMHKSLGEGTTEQVWSTGAYSLERDTLLPLLGLLIVLASAYRLAKFNVDDRQTDSFIGLPTPANALWIVSIPLLLMYQSSTFATAFFGNFWVLAGLTVLGSFLLLAELPLFAFKFKTKSFKANSLRYLFLVVSGVLLAVFWFAAIPLIILLYLLTSFLVYLKNKKST